MEIRKLTTKLPRKDPEKRLKLNDPCLCGRLVSHCRYERFTVFTNCFSDFRLKDSQRLVPSDANERLGWTYVFQNSDTLLHKKSLWLLVVQALRPGSQDSVAFPCFLNLALLISKQNQGGRLCLEGSSHEVHLVSICSFVYIHERTESPINHEKRRILRCQWIFLLEHQ